LPPPLFCQHRRQRERLLPYDQRQRLDAGRLDGGNGGNACRRFALAPFYRTRTPAHVARWILFF
jgi:hypothetical protein